MKKLFLLIALVTLVTTASAQFQTLGLRMGFGGELSAQMKGGPGRIEADLGLFRHYKNATLAYHFVNNLQENLGWFYGLGGTVGIWDNTGVSAGAVGVIGLEYNFNLPIQVSIDYRPVFYLINGNDIGFFDFTAAGIGIRYRF